MIIQGLENRGLAKRRREFLFTRPELRTMTSMCIKVHYDCKPQQEFSSLAAYQLREATKDSVNKLKGSIEKSDTCLICHQIIKEQYIHLECNVNSEKGRLYHIKINDQIFSYLNRNHNNTLNTYLNDLLNKLEANFSLALDAGDPD